MVVLDELLVTQIRPNPSAGAPAKAPSAASMGRGAMVVPQRGAFERLSATPEVPETAIGPVATTVTSVTSVTSVRVAAPNDGRDRPGPGERPVHRLVLRRAMPVPLIATTPRERATGEPAATPHPREGHVRVSAVLVPRIARRGRAVKVASRRRLAIVDPVCRRGVARPAPNAGLAN